MQLCLQGTRAEQLIKDERRNGREREIWIGGNGVTEQYEKNKITEEERG